MDAFLYKNKEVFVHYTDVLPSHINGLVRERNGSYMILIKNTLSDSKKLKTLIHELNHIKEDDFSKLNTVFEIEKGVNNNEARSKNA